MRSRSPVKSVSTVSVDPTVAIATRLAAAICSFTNLRAESTARWTSSGCIELTSKSSTISRRPASASLVIGTGVVSLAGVARAGSFIFASTPASSAAGAPAAAGGPRSPER